VCEAVSVWCTVQSIHTTLVGYHVQLSFKNHCLIPHEIEIFVSYHVAMNSNDIWLPKTSSFIPHSGSVPSYFPCTIFLYVLPSSQSQHSAKKTSFSLPHASLPGLISRSLAAVLSFLLSCHDRAVSIMFTTFFLLLKLHFLIFLTYVLFEFLKTKLFSSSLPSPHHTCLEQLYLP